MGSLVESALERAAAATEASHAAGAMLELCEVAADDLDERSFEVFDVAMQHAATCLAVSTQLMLKLAETASAREVFCMIMEAFGKRTTAGVYLLLLRALAVVLPRLSRRRGEFIATCLTSLSARYLDEWPGGSWDEEAEAAAGEAPANGTAPSPPSLQLLAALLNIAELLVPEAAAVAKPNPNANPDLNASEAAAVATEAAKGRTRLLTLGFVWRLLLTAHAQGSAVPDVDRTDACACSRPVHAHVHAHALCMCMLTTCACACACSCPMRVHAYDLCMRMCMLMPYACACACSRPMSHVCARSMPGRAAMLSSAPTLSSARVLRR